MRDYAVMETPLGNVKVEVFDGYLISLQFTDEIAPDKFLDGVLMDVRIQLGLYFQGKQKTFDIPVALGGTDFQRKVWLEINKIPFSETSTYEKIALKLGKPGAERAVGSAIGANPILIMLPCHRVIGKSGQLTGYAGGLWRKSELLDLEKKDQIGKQVSLSF
ncbi:methylated-DNA-protein-cysteine methyltransferase [Rhodonellum psychrophilum GCM71 = DSM 17998]|uniref:methylated-DNA--[protein]-cysteine S-methyltransferase n=2 Tax=Rhodonellum TaxID=336827 RepID=U5BZ37_9BACT|nr:MULTISPECIES: methylated-DNA--[protein]-cysteine S-methyltransferase [Rhodonellum]ERM81916.1 methylated-DNA-protein-cysteine methyltransferase [Rhodonellum psychrophilum GCM71 = DSM 17998]MDO9552184.1 methylated-DNA--[protein]-cysteine S-methyltransferase [Rhodonellum sp.]SDZ49326.1 methylated-DNA-[protein]-cysteine S-methyltransferase [Rhodonellum ikkaensis]